MSYVPDQAASLLVRGQYFSRSKLDPGLWQREATEEEGGGVVKELTTKQLLSYGGFVAYYDENGDKLL
jgi:hypothetical protein